MRRVSSAEATVLKGERQKMRRILVVCMLLGAGCSTETEKGRRATNREATQVEQLSLTPMQLEGRLALEKRGKDRAALAALESRVSKAMEKFLIDPFSAKYASLRKGRNGAICGEVNAKNRMGAYVGSRPFVLSGDGSSIHVSAYSDGVVSEWYSLFSEAYIAACATADEKTQFEVDTNVEPYTNTYSPTDNSSSASDFEDDLQADH